MIAVDTQKLAEVLGLKEWPVDPELLTEQQCMAARTITDFVGSKSAEVAMTNAVSWIRYAQEEGFRLGVSNERDRWYARIGNLFDVPVVKP